MIVCPACGKAFSKVPVWPLRCSCGQKTTFEEMQSAFWIFPKPKNAWHIIHQWIADRWRAGNWNALEASQWYVEQWLPIVPESCCGDHWRTLTAQYVIDWTTAESAFRSLWQLHNEVSLNRSKKPTIPLAEAQGLFQCPVVRKPRAVITCAIGEQHQELLSHTRPYLQEYADRCGADYCEFTNDLRPDWPMANKYRMTSYAWHYEQSLLIDCDVLVKLDAPDIFEEAGESPIAARDERPDYRPDDWFVDECRDFYKSQGVEFQPGRCVNAGVMVLRHEALEKGLYIEPPKPYPKYWCGEQFWLWYQTRDTGVKWLDDRFNWAAIREDFNRGVDDAWFIHLNGVPHQQRIDFLTTFQRLQSVA